jgi:hypothetical protein
MILAHLARSGAAWPNRIDAGLPNGASVEMLMKDAPKERFYAQKSFTIGSASTPFQKSLVFRLT